MGIRPGEPSPGQREHWRAHLIVRRLRLEALGQEEPPPPPALAGRPEFDPQARRAYLQRLQQALSQLADANPLLAHVALACLDDDRSRAGSRRLHQQAFWGEMAERYGVDERQVRHWLSQAWERLAAIMEGPPTRGAAGASDQAGGEGPSSPPASPSAPGGRT